MTSLSNDLRAALKEMPKVVVLQWVGNLALMLLAALWLQIPDSHVWQFVLSILSGLVIVLAVLWLYTRTVSNLRRPVMPALRRMLLLVLFVALWFLVLHSIGMLREKEPLLAGFWNSKLPPNLRYFFNYARLIAWQEYLYNLVQWIVAGFLLPLALESSTRGLSSTSLKRSVGVYRHWLYWLVVIIAGFAGTALAKGLAGWTPGKGIAVETVSLLARLGVVYTADILLWCFVLALTSIYLEAAEAA
jgi:hypothetical protein